jgi:hypothetical protein
VNTPTFKYDFDRAARRAGRRRQLWLITATAGAPLAAVVAMLREVIR